MKKKILKRGVALIGSFAIALSLSSCGSDVAS